MNIIFLKLTFNVIPIKRIYEWDAVKNKLKVYFLSFLKNGHHSNSLIKTYRGMNDKQFELIETLINNTMEIYCDESNN